MAGSNNRRPGWAEDRMLDVLNKTDAIDLAWALAARLCPDGADVATPRGILEIMADEADALGRQDEAMARAASKLRQLRDQLQAGHEARCIRRKPRSVGTPISDLYTGAGWRTSPDGAYICPASCKVA